VNGVCFDVVAASLPGYGFSQIPDERGMDERRMAALMVGLMERLGHERFAARGSDIGGGVLTQMGALFPDRLIGLHLSGIRPVVVQVPDDLTDAEKALVKQAQEWGMFERAYAALHSTKPQTVAHGLNDSPAGLAAWIVEKFRSWSDCGGDVEKRFSKDELLTNLTIYWATQTIVSSIRVYFEIFRAGPLPGVKDVPVAMLMAAHDLVTPPREWVERSGPIARWSQLDTGGHFLEWEEPALVADDMRAFFGELAASAA
jgi:pimeloyl-ACP methyl ester carboxylesterase